MKIYMNDGAQGLPLRGLKYSLLKIWILIFEFCLSISLDISHDARFIKASLIAFLVAPTLVSLFLKPVGFATTL